MVAYACDPEHGSEEAAAWALTRHLAEFTNPVVLVSTKHIDRIHRWQHETGDDRVTYIGVPIPRWASLARKTRPGWFLVYLSWLKRAFDTATQLHHEEPFGLTFHASLSTYWLPSPIARLGVPSVWGPVGGAVTTPVPLWPALGWRGLLIEWFDFISVRLAAFYPATRRTWRDVSVRIVQNEETLNQLPRDLRPGTRVLNHVQFIRVPPLRRNVDRDLIVFTSPLESRKGPRLAVRALSRTSPRIRLRILGDGPERSALERLAQRLGISHRVEFRGRVPRPRVFESLSEAGAALFTGLREEGGVALAEALFSGVPTIVLANGGPEVIARSCVDPDRVVLIEPADVETTSVRIAEAIERFVGFSPTNPGPNIDRSASHSILREIVLSAVTTPVRNHQQGGRACKTAETV